MQAKAALGHEQKVFRVDLYEMTWVSSTQGGLRIVGCNFCLCLVGDIVEIFWTCPGKVAQALVVISDINCPFWEHEEKKPSISHNSVHYKIFRALTSQNWMPYWVEFIYYTCKSACNSLVILNLVERLKNMASQTFRRSYFC